MIATAPREAIHAQRSRHFLWWPVFLGAGAGAYFAIPVEPPLMLSGNLLGVVAIGGILALRRATAISILVWLLLLSLLGFALASLRTHMVSAPVLPETYFGAAEGRVIKLDRSQNNRLRILLDDVVLHGLAPHETPARVRITLPWKDARVEAGARVLVQTRLAAPGAPVEPGGFDFRKWAWFERLGGIGIALGPVMLAPDPPRGDLMLALARWRYGLSDYIQQQIPERDGGFAAAILTGDRSGIDPSLLGDLRNSNLAHLLAISGLHMGLLTGFVFGLVRLFGALCLPKRFPFPAKKLAAICAIFAGLGYLLLSGLSIATQRAFIMALVFFMAILLERPALTLRAVALAAVMVLIIAPESITEAGFQLSFAATTGLVLVFEALRGNAIWRKPRRGAQRFFKGVLTVAISSAVAGLATAPIGAFHFNQMAQYGLLANVISVPIMGFVVMPAALLGFIAVPLGMEPVFFWAAGQGIAAILSVAGWVSGLKGAVILIPSGPGVVLPLMALGALMVGLWMGRMRWIGLAPLALALVIWLHAPRPDILIDETGKLVGIMTEEGRALSKGRGQGFSAAIWLEHDGDAADQKLASRRRAPNATAAFAIADNAKDLSRLCSAHKVVIAPSAGAVSEMPCTMITRETLAQTGALAIYFGKDKEPPLIKTARARDGARLWTSLTSKAQ